MPPHRDEDESDGSKDTCNCSSSSSSNRRDTFSRRFRRFFLIDAISMWIYNRSCSCADECTRWKTLLREVVTEATDWPHCGCSRCRSTNGNTPSRQVSLIGRSRVLHLISSISFSFFFLLSFESVSSSSFFLWLLLELLLFHTMMEVMMILWKRP